ncbi:uncharacterized protein BDR25DRAFT_320269 [Lindgomyces ingoldianus]|uniref:Uncharacterized protein n=1 Tax=Lindgomyces ingoldianus TaxID=673940 RepID=A0ACB6Q888_9PLEO|nr:uncharacterized protein BDR25DRAFT_320269 [Lindgomyces ingoldianus]KAF2463082.1 hypothetical protein BDR25DRAFT_320269 [Lindgomyces ingoldianus]
MTSSFFVRYLLQIGANPNNKIGRSGRRSLATAVLYLDLGAIKLLLDNGADANTRLESLISLALEAAFYYRFLRDMPVLDEVLLLLLRARAAVDERADGGLQAMLEEFEVGIQDEI